MIIVFSDLDGTLLDHHTYSYSRAQEGLRILRERKAPLVLVSSKTFAEMKELHRELGLQAPFIFENGGGIALPDETGADDGYSVSIEGLRASELKQQFHLVQEMMPGPCRALTDMSVQDIVSLTGLPEKRAELARMRLASVPFIMDSEVPVGKDELDRMNLTMKSNGLALTKGGRFFHLISAAADKGTAVLHVKNMLSKTTDETIITVGLGDSENDIPLLKSVDRAFIVRKYDGTVIETGLENVRETEKIGPEGFSEAVKSLWNN